jgi:short-subunit dehydrogenase
MTCSSILITGASSGIGAALARRYAGPGVRLTLWGRDAVRLAAVADACRAKGATIDGACFDLADLDRLTAELTAVDQASPLDLAILSAGLGGSLPARPAGQDAAAVRAMAAINFTVPVVMANLLADRMAARSTGRLVFIGSLAAAFPLPMAPLYAGTKAGLTVFAEALAIRLRPFGVGVTLVSPGFVDTPMSQSLSEPRPFLISADAAAAAIAAAVARGTGHLVLPWPFALLRALSGLLPRRLLLAILSGINRRFSR